MFDLEVISGRIRLKIPRMIQLIIIGPDYADAVIEFTNDFFQHVHVMPER